MYCNVLQLKGLLMAIYFGADHVVWAGQAGLISNKQTLERYCSRLPDTWHAAHKITCCSVRLALHLLP